MDHLQNESISRQLQSGGDLWQKSRKDRYIRDSENTS